MSDLNWTPEELQKVLQQDGYSVKGEMAERTIAPDCKSGVRKGYAGPNPALPTISEEAFQKQIIDTAHLYGWKVAHFRKARTAHGWVTPVAADGKGFPDLILVHPGRCKIMAIEVKTDKGKLRPEQEAWQRALLQVIVCEVWRPVMWERIIEILKGKE